MEFEGRGHEESYKIVSENFIRRPVHSEVEFLVVDILLHDFFLVGSQFFSDLQIVYTYTVFDEILSNFVSQSTIQPYQKF